MLYLFLAAETQKFVTLAGVAAALLLTLILTNKLMSKLPTDIGRAYAVNAAAAKGKPRGAGIIFVSVFAFTALIFIPLTIENIIYYVLLIFAMLSGYLDDASRIPWSDYKKGAIDLVISLGCAATFALCNGTDLTFLFLDTTVTLPLWLYILLGTILVWMSINVTNCTDGVDGLCTSLSLISLGGFIYVMSLTGHEDFIPTVLIFMACVIGYLRFNASPSILLMGDAGSRTIGVFFALAAMKCGCPVIYLIICAVFIVDGGLGLVKIFLLRFLKIKILVNVRTPLHDQARKNKGWSDTQTVIRFCLIQLVVIFIWLWIFG